MEINQVLNLSQSLLQCQIKVCHDVTLFDMGCGGGGHDCPTKFFDHCAQTLSGRKLKLCHF